MYIQLNSQIICYEKTGEGSPVILLHGNKGDHHTFDKLAERMSRNYTVYAMDSRGYGESATPKEYHYADMASDVINLIEALDIDRPYLVGFSDGGIVALLAAIRRSDLLSGIVTCGANLTPAGIERRELHDMKKEYKSTKDPKTLMMLTEPDISKRDLAQIKVPALIMAGEKDCIKRKETEAIAAGIAGAQLKILPRENHYSYVVDTDMLYDHIRDFLLL